MLATNVDPVLQKKLKRESLTYCSDSKPGFFRQKDNKKFKYYDAEGKRLTDNKELARIDSLGIPPAWKNVWVCPQGNGHLQATGVDDKRRKQYIYHPDWIKISQENKFSKMIDFGLKLPKIRGKVKYDLASPKLDKRKVLATVIWLLEHTFIRIGNEEYSKENQSFGLTTLRNRHVNVRGSEASFQFQGKSGVFHTLEITNPTIVKTIKRCIELPGYELFQFIDEKGDRHVIDSADVNAFLKEVTNDDFSAKDFRTWGATNLSANNLYKEGHGKNKTHAKKIVSQTIKNVAHHLNNTVKVCRSYYIHPVVLETYHKKILVPHFAYYDQRRINKNGLDWDELALIRLLQKHS